VLTIAAKKNQMGIRKMNKKPVVGWARVASNTTAKHNNMTSRFALQIEFI
jgi:hypothetical protein